ncbi:iron chelate uptake ABC transporter family permease subunit [Rhodobacter maris]|uniref:Iron complex transport system permease protein n=1 Tax=Rhodobacter maris TaxID=446682 RepID=A0A285SXV5_9RHOB|nr:iron chelate uptake ABC transporter family permease subunit [Rhodobacter maris]SOC11627.1 iron complex transport system permease protein [Rhodobacter maris]
MRTSFWGALGALLATVIALWLFQGLTGNTGFVLSLRAKKLAALMLVAASVGMATVLFQSVAQNRILTPSIMGFDALYLLVQSLALATLGITGFVTLPAGPKFLIETAVMAALAVALFGTLLGRGGGRDIGRTILSGVILGILFRAGATLVARLLDPNANAVVQSVSFANFSRPSAEALGWAALVALPAMAAALWLGPRLDVMALGRDRAVSLGLRYRAMVLAALFLVALLTVAATALVGPVAFLGLIVAGLAHGLAPGARHRTLLTLAALLAALMLVGGQWAFERLFGLKATLSVVIEFAGGLLFLTLLMRGKIR